MVNSPKVVRRGCKRWLELREQKSPQESFAPSETRFAPVQPHFPLVQPHFRALGSKDLLHPLLTTFGNLPRRAPDYSSNVPA